MIAQGDLGVAEALQDVGEPFPGPFRFQQCVECGSGPGIVLESQQRQRVPVSGFTGQRVAGMVTLDTGELTGGFVKCTDLKQRIARVETTDRDAVIPL